MQELTFSTMIAVFEEMFGRTLFWSLVVLAALGLLAFVWTVWRDRGIQSSRFLVAEIIGVFGGVAAVLFVQAITRSGFADIGGAVDLITVFLIWLAGAIGTIMIAYIVKGLLLGRRSG